MPETLLFYVFSGVSVVAAALINRQRNPMYRIMLLIASFGALLAGLLIVQLVWALIRATDTSAAVGARGDVAAISSVRSVGRVLFTDYSFAFEATSVLILVAMVGAVLLAAREPGR